jgi:hypothetical protein
MHDTRIFGLKRESGLLRQWQGVYVRAQRYTAGWEVAQIDDHPGLGEGTWGKAQRGQFVQDVLLGCMFLKT